MADVPWSTVPELVQASATAFAEREAVVEGDLSISYADLADRIFAASAAVIDAGVEPGDRVAIWAPNVHEWIVAALGALSVGAVLVPLNTRYKGAEAGYILGKSRARLLFTITGFLDTDYVDLLRRAHGGPEGARPVAELEHLERIVVLRGDAPEGTESFEEFLGRADGVADDDVFQRWKDVEPDDLCDIMFTSGTTGRPKGVMVGHAQTMKVFEVWSREVGLREGDRYLIVNPFFHTFGYKAGILAALMRGATIVPHAVFDAGQVADLIAAQRVTMLPGPPALYQSILNLPDLGERDLSSLRLAVTGAATVPVELIRRMREDLGFDVVLTAYGLTESTGVVSMCRPDDDYPTIANRCGRAIPDTEVRIVDEQGNALPADTPGEVVVRGYNVMRGYFEDPEQTAEAIVDGWLHTGDIGVMDERGYLKITDRKKDMFIVGGFNAYPAEIENDLSRHPRIAAAAVVGMPDDRLGEVGCAFVVPRTGEEPPAEDEVIAWCREEMANYKVPRRVIVVDAFPANASGKVLKNELRERAAREAGA